jgi:hypothetical protein
MEMGPTASPGSFDAAASGSTEVQICDNLRIRTSLNLIAGRPASSPRGSDPVAGPPSEIAPFSFMRDRNESMLVDRARKLLMMAADGGIARDVVRQAAQDFIDASRGADAGDSAQLWKYSAGRIRFRTRTTCRWLWRPRDFLWSTALIRHRSLLRLSNSYSELRRWRRISMTHASLRFLRMQMIGMRSFGRRQSGCARKCPRPPRHGCD